MPWGTIKLNDGNEIPAIAFGTGTALRNEDSTAYVEQAIESGFSHIDTAAIYRNEEGVGAAIKESGLNREDLYITTKYDGGVIRDEVEKSLAKLGLKQLDLYLIHAPGFVKGKLEDAWKEFEIIKEDALAKSIGVSNFSLEDLQLLLKTAKIKPAVNQIRFNPYNWAEIKDLVEYSDKHGIVTEAYSSLTPITRTPGGPVDAPLNAIAKRLGATPAQVIFKWVQSKGVVVVTTSSRKERLQEYLDVADLPDLTEADIAAIEEAGAKSKPSRKSKQVAVYLGQLAVLTALTYAFSYLVRYV
ncbi:Aldo/keto reductase [Rickenella mellea]|uniref:Aldo/keto reductase n=1 Tax=Rickenella mellea TaxID=50990 RepID=A0A4Y7Q6G0_9AGAM|nr:Aldo/keto reductase [Rickenella mellea]